MLLLAVQMASIVTSAVQVVSIVTAAILLACAAWCSSRNALPRANPSDVEEVAFVQQPTRRRACRPSVA
jgi:hypothetical protein